MRKKIKLFFKIITILFGLFVIVLIALFYYFSTPKTDAKILKSFAKDSVNVIIKHQQFKGFNYRVLVNQKKIDTTLSTIIFIHGSIGAATDFKAYLIDKDLNKKANLIAYDRVGYGVDNAGNVQESIAFETELLNSLTKDYNLSKTILVGYSYGGPIALASKKKYKKIVLLAPAVYSKVEPMPWALNLYKWKATRWLVPEIWKSASKEKLSHKIDLEQFENNWNTNPSKIISIHGDSDWIVPYENSLYLKDKFSLQQFELVTLPGAGHGLVWSHFKNIKTVLLQQLNN